MYSPASMQLALSLISVLSPRPLLGLLIAGATVVGDGTAQQTPAAPLKTLRRAFHPAAESSHPDRMAAIEGLGDARRIVVDRQRRWCLRLRIAAGHEQRT